MPYLMENKPMIGRAIIVIAKISPSVISILYSGLLFLIHMVPPPVANKKHKAPKTIKTYAIIFLSTTNYNVLVINDRIFQNNVSKV